MKSFFWLAPDANRDERDTFADLDRMFALRGELINESNMSHLNRIQVGEKHYYVKVYHLAGRNLRRFVGRSRVRAEWHNQSLFGEFGIPSARIVAFGERGRTFGAKQGAIVTEEIPETLDLAHVIEKRPDLLADRYWTGQVIDRLADYVRAMHGHRFVHNDLKWRNILVDLSQGPEVYIIDCPWGRTLFGPLLQRGIVKDLACLDRLAKRHLSRSQRLRFFKRYHDTDCLTEVQVKQMERVLRFFEGREE